MFLQQKAPKTGLTGALGLLALIYHSTVRDIRKGSGNAVLGLLKNIFQTVILIVVFYVMFTLLGLRGNAIRGDFVLYIMSGIFLFMTYNKAMGAVVSSYGPASPMMQHAPMNTVVSITSAALSALYTQILSMVVVLYIYHAAFTHITIEQPAAAMGMVLLSWFSGASVGMLLLALRPWFPGLTGIISMIYQRANMIASGKMFVANTLPHHLLVMFSWNPLFHTIDQTRGFVFINYNPHYSSVMYPVYVSLALMMIGLMGEFYTRKRASLSWSARR